MDPLIISCAVTGALGTIEENPHLPYDPEAIGRSCVEAWEQGASVVHLHARADDGSPAWEPEAFQRSIDVIREAGSDVIVNLTTSWGGLDPATDWERRLAPIDLRPDIVSFDCGTLTFGPGTFYNETDFLRELGRRCLDAGVKPELEIFHDGQLGIARKLLDEGVLAEPLFFQFVLGVHGGAPATQASLLHLVSQLPEGATWSCCAIGRPQLAMNAAAIVAGGHARTGLEDNLWYRRGEHATNGMLVERVRRLAELLERPVATPAQARELLGLPARAAA